MPDTEKIRKVILRPLLEDHNKIVGLITHLNEELNEMINSDEPDTSFIEISISMISDYIRHYHLLETDIITHFEQYELNVEHKLKVMTLFKEHRESLPLIDKLIGLQGNLDIEKGDKLTGLLVQIKDTCDEFHKILHELGQKYFANVLVDDTNHLISENGSGRRNQRFELDVAGEIINDDPSLFIACHMADLSESGMTVISDKDYKVGEKISVRCDVEGRPVFNCLVLRKEKSDDGSILHLEIQNYAECNSVIKNMLDHGDVV